MRVVPFIRRKPGQDEDSDGDAHVGRDHVHPHIGTQWVQEGEEIGWLVVWLTIKNTKKYNLLFIIQVKLENSVCR